MKNLTIAVTATLFIQGCATSYHKYGFGGGYSETQLDENVFNVSFRGVMNTLGEKELQISLYCAVVS